MYIPAPCSVRKNNRAAVLIMTMMAICLTFMMIYVLTHTSGIGLSSTSSFYDREMALQAAQSGVDYAVTQLQTNKAWRGDCNAKYWTGSGSNTAQHKQKYNDGDLYVIESYGNVIGLLTGKSGSKSAFRIKFNYEDTSDEVKRNTPCSRFADVGAEEPQPSVAINMPYVSINNLNNMTEALAYRANSDGKGIAGKTYNLELFSADDVTRGYANHVPPQRMCLIVEGLAGKGLRDCIEPEDVNKAITAGKHVVRRYVETYYSFTPPVFKGYAASAKQNFKVTCSDGKMFVKSVGYQAEDYKIPASGSLRSDGGFAMKGAVLNTYGGKLYSPQAQREGVNYINDNDEYTFRRFSGYKRLKRRRQYVEVYDYKTLRFQTAYEQSSGEIETVDENRVASASSSNGALQKGFYQWHVTDDTKTSAQKNYELRYYPNEDGTTRDEMNRPVPSSANKYDYKIVVSEVPAQEADKYVTVTHADGSTVKHEKVTMVDASHKDKIAFCTDENGKITKPILYLRGKLYCDGNLTISTDVTEISNTCPVVNICQYTPSNSAGQPVSSQAEDGVLLANGDLTILSSVRGSGAVVAPNHDVYMVGESVLDSASNGLAVYAKDVNFGSLDVTTTANLDNSTVPASGGSSGESGSGEGGTEYLSLTYGELFQYINNAMQNNQLQLQMLKDSKETLFGDNNVEVFDAGSHQNREAGGEGYIIDYYWFKFKFKNGSGNSSDTNEYTVKVKPFVLGQDCWIEASGGSFVSLDNLLIPQDARGSSSPSPTPSATPDPSAEEVIDDNIEETGTYIPETKDDYAKKFGSLAYGDQIFNGLIYATNNFNVKLDGKYKLIVKGAIRAENGSIDMDCSGIDLTYDESCLEKLLPQHGSMSCIMWNCW